MIICHLSIWGTSEPLCAQYGLRRILRERVPRGSSEPPWQPNASVYLTDSQQPMTIGEILPELEVGDAPATL